MKEQNYKNHAKYVIGYHVILFGVTVALLVVSIVNLVKAINHHINLLQPSMFILIAIAFVMLFIYVRGFPLAVQDRVIRTEENLRHFILTGKLLDTDLTLPQIIALRFAADEEFIALTERAIKDKLTNKEIKAAISKWKADHHRA